MLLIVRSYLPTMLDVYSTRYMLICILIISKALYIALTGEHSAEEESYGRDEPGSFSCHNLGKSFLIK